MTLILIEDESSERERYKSATEFRKDVEIIGMTGSSEEGLRLTRLHEPEGVILDLELSKGQGGGIKYLQALNEAADIIKPIIVVTTNNLSSVVQNIVRDLNVEYIFGKRQSDYSMTAVFDMLLMLRNALANSHYRVEGEEQSNVLTKDERINAAIQEEFEMIGIRAGYKGYEYLRGAILLRINDSSNTPDSGITSVAKSTGKSYSTVLRAMQAAINKAWYSTEKSLLDKHYTAKVDVRTGVPTAGEFLQYYVQKIRKVLGVAE